MDRFLLGLLKFSVWLGLRMVFVVVLFGGIGLLATMSMEPIETESQELIFLCAFCVVGFMAIWLFWSLVRLIFDSISSFRRGLNEGQSND